MAGGRPTKYNDDMLRIADEYLTTFKTTHKHLLPTVIGLSEILQVTEKTVYNWAEKKENKEFLQLLRLIKGKQQRMLIENGLTGDYNAAITKLMLTKHGYSDKVEQDNKSSDGSMTPTVIERVIIDPARQ